MRSVSDRWRALGKKDLSLRIRIGLGDPADTGRLWDFLGLVSALLAGVRSLSVLLQPEFADEILAVSGGGRLRVIPLQVDWNR